jgi:hypothetical protein
MQEATNRCVGKYTSDQQRKSNTARSAQFALVQRLVYQLEYPGMARCLIHRGMIDITNSLESHHVASIRCHAVRL